MGSLTKTRIIFIHLPLKYNNPYKSSVGYGARQDVRLDSCLAPSPNTMLTLTVKKKSLSSGLGTKDRGATLFPELFRFFSSCIGPTRWDLLKFRPTAPRGIHRAGRWFAPTTSSLKGRNAVTLPLHHFKVFVKYYIF